MNDDDRDPYAIEKLACLALVITLVLGLLACETVSIDTVETCSIDSTTFATLKLRSNVNCSNIEHRLDQYTDPVIGRFDAWIAKDEDGSGTPDNDLEKWEHVECTETQIDESYTIKCRRAGENGEYDFRLFNDAGGDATPPR